MKFCVSQMLVLFLFFPLNSFAQLKVGAPAATATTTETVDLDSDAKAENSEVSTNDEADHEGVIPLYRFERSQNFPLWSVGFNFGLTDVMGPNQLSSAASPGLIWGLEAAYHRQANWGLRANLGQQDVTESKLGVSYLFVGAEAVVPLEFKIKPYVGLGLSLNSVSGYGSDYFQPGFGMYVGGDYILEGASKWSLSPRFQYSQIMSKGGRESVDFWAFFVSIAYTFDETEFTDNVKIINAK